MLDAFPIVNHQASRTLYLNKEPCHFDALCQHFSDTIVLIITPHGRIGQIVSVELSMDLRELDLDSEDMLLPSVSLTPRFLLGSSDTSRSLMAELLAVHLGTALTKSVRDGVSSLMLFLTLPGTDRHWDKLDDEVKSEFLIEVLQLVTPICQR